MSQQLYKMRLDYGYRPEPEDDGTASSIILTGIIRYDNQTLAKITTLKANLWLATNHCSSHLLNVYDNKEEGLLFVFNNRDTAIMLKLAMA